jgi:DNA-binding FrmR family transcriptional regulator
MQKKIESNNSEVKNSKLITRVKRINGQIKGIEDMITNGRQCDEVIQQIIAARSALASLGIEVILENNANCKLGDKAPIDMKRYLTNIFKLS